MSRVDGQDKHAREVPPDGRINITASRDPCAERSGESLDDRRATGISSSFVAPRERIGSGFARRGGEDAENGDDSSTSRLTRRSQTSRWP